MDYVNCNAGLKLYLPTGSIVCGWVIVSTQDWLRLTDCINAELTTAGGLHQQKIGYGYEIALRVDWLRQEVMLD